MPDPIQFAEAFNLIPDLYKWAALILLGGFIFSLIRKWGPRDK